ncbi:thiamine biosynthesis protein ThiS [Deltaproteobacteria bacterium Smac51]|nr:thiamine biosynthesis protein ThiS [Deltaproteobacteria bacterium Smac51]
MVFANETTVFYLEQLMRLNGQPYETETPRPLAEILREAGFDCERVAVMLNGRIVPRDQLDSARVAADDELEVVSFVGGG